MNRRLLLFASIAVVVSSLTFAQEAPKKRYLVGTRGPAERFELRRSIDRLDVDISRFRAVNGFAAELTEEYRRLLGQLGDAELESVAVWRLEGYSVDEIASKLGCAPRSVKRKLQLIRNLWSSEGMV